MTQENNNKGNDVQNSGQKTTLGLKLRLAKNIPTMNLNDIITNIDLNKQAEKPIIFPEKIEPSVKITLPNSESQLNQAVPKFVPEVIINQDSQNLDSTLNKNEEVLNLKPEPENEKSSIVRPNNLNKIPRNSVYEKRSYQSYDKSYDRRHQSSDDNKRRSNYDNRNLGGFNQYEHETRLAVLKAAAENRKNKEEEIAKLRKVQEEIKKAEEFKQAVELEVKRKIELENASKLQAEAKIQEKLKTEKESSKRIESKAELKNLDSVNPSNKIETKALSYDNNDIKLKKSLEFEAKNIRPTVNSSDILAKRKEAEDLIEENKRKENARIAAALRDKKKENIRPGMLNTYKDENEGDAKEIFSSRQQAYRKKSNGKNNRLQKPINAFIAQDIIIDESHSLKELANLMNIKTSEVIKALVKIDKKMRYKEDTQLDADITEFLVLEFGHRPIFKSLKTIDSLIVARIQSARNLTERPPVVTIMGHVDHGKTSLLDALRSSNVVATESGGITQHIGAYQITSKSGKKISFIDTPGHEAFTAIRARGAQATDIVILVVAADDGVMPQTIEAIRHAQVANVPMIVAINKIDKTNGDITTISNQLIQYDVILENVGGEIMAVPISAKNKTNLDKLEEAILLQAEIMELKVDESLKATGVIIESKINNVKGCCATLLIQNGTLKIGDILITNDKFCKVRAMNDEHGKPVKFALPSTAVEVFGFEKTPDVGQKFIIVKNEKEAKGLLEEFANNDLKQQRLVERGESSAIDIFSILGDLSQETMKELKFIIKADVSGTIDAVKFSLDKLNSDLVSIKVLYAATGIITESDIALAKSSGAVVCGFNINVNSTIQNLVNKEKVTLRSYTIIYQLIDDVQAMIDNKLKPQKIEKPIGKALVKQIFMISGTDKIAGCEVKEGLVSHNGFVRIKRIQKGIHNIIGENIEIKKLKRHKDDVREVTSGLECGIALEKFDNIIAGDILEIYNIIENI